MYAIIEVGGMQWKVQKSARIQVPKINAEPGKSITLDKVLLVVDKDTVTTHTKFLIIDKKIVILGSTNWTFSALSRNHEISAVIHSEESASFLQDFFEKVKKEGKKL